VGMTLILGSVGQEVFFFFFLVARHMKMFMFLILF
jgi:hypothetical protein